ncbi:MAG TPA: hypothetical protein VM325_02395 [Alphaproteobacteria bacterium]|nr:hypothetical protein [Alphaproteobacteria bacterium]
MENRASNEDRRGSHREKMLGTGLISWSNGYRSMACVVLDWTRSGARIKPADMMGCPEEFTLVTGTGKSVPCEVRWRENTLMGVSFL